MPRRAGLARTNTEGGHLRAAVEAERGDDAAQEARRGVHAHGARAEQCDRAREHVARRVLRTVRAHQPGETLDLRELAGAGRAGVEVRARVARGVRREASFGQINEPLEGDVLWGQLHNFISAGGLLRAAPQRQCATGGEKYTAGRPKEKGAPARPASPRTFRTSACPIRRLL
ncbi:MAG: hypothetical protein DMF67_17565 [Acidobacteria bacterium]|nr:MAG: hypothetical protein DMF67_17565 [Acidobacteriota bacterium]